MNKIIEYLPDTKEGLATLYFLSILVAYSSFYFWALAVKGGQEDDLPTISYDD